MERQDESKEGESQGYRSQDRLDKRFVVFTEMFRQDVEGDDY